ncbi:hypothetical protein BDV96DRAFT_648208 [Lophiotrema nucula]|uniref:Uncharacterized protein n=1 Tax=Lophiotrema nucula TaxID=690887 RepID=A0A6A5Z1C2_9PLEO|nr:hypothetical protein BDV96DRAFT_648208 [Lophiotrema nucula]
MSIEAVAKAKSPGVKEGDSPDTTAGAEHNPIPTDYMNIYRHDAAPELSASRPKSSTSPVRDQTDIDAYILEGTASFDAPFHIGTREDLQSFLDMLQARRSGKSVSLLVEDVSHGTADLLDETLHIGLETVSAHTKGRVNDNGDHSQSQHYMDSIRLNLWDGNSSKENFHSLTWWRMFLHSR